MLDPFHHHPDLRNRITPAAASYFRDMNLAEVDAHAAKAGMPAGWRTPDAVREAGRHAVLSGRMGRDLWVFGYGSLMWDPGMEFTELRRAHSPGFARRFCLWDEGGRGTVVAPGLMLAIDEAEDETGCDGLAFCLAADTVDHETFVLFRREMIADGYRPVWLALETAQGPIEALSFAADRSCKDIRPGIPLAEQARMIATAQGFLGTNADYLSNVRTHLHHLGVSDAYIEGLWSRVVAQGGV